ncbi:MAG: hypothetical protein U1E81_18320 [Xanthobacteraceae bacterium]
MRPPARRDRPDPRSAGAFGLFPSEKEIARRLSQDAASWRAKAQVLERDGLPRIDPIMGGRYWPAVRAFWNKRYGLSTVEVSQPDGGEDLDALR